MINAHSSRNACDLVFYESLYHVFASVGLCISCNVMVMIVYWQLTQRKSDGGDENSDGGDENSDGGDENGELLVVSIEQTDGSASMIESSAGVREKKVKKEKVEEKVEKETVEILEGEDRIVGGGDAVLRRRCL